MTKRIKHSKDSVKKVNKDFANVLSLQQVFTSSVSAEIVCNVINALSSECFYANMT